MTKIINTLLYLIVLLMMVSTDVMAQTDKVDYYSAGYYEYGGITLPYRELDLHQNKDGKSILVIQLHGGTARGDDNEAQLAASAVDSVEIYLNTHGIKSIFLLPQCGVDRVWNENANNYDITMTMVLEHWIQDFITNHPNVDVTRIYITGYSAGGSGSWRMINDYQSMFAAAGIAAANPVMVTAENCKNTPVYAIAGSEDRIMNATRIENFVNQMVALGGDALFDLLEGKDHFGTCDTAFTNERLDWLFAHRRCIAGDVNCDGAVTAADVTAIYDYMLSCITTYLATSDVNNDGTVTSSDITAIYNILLGAE
ncbi:MAG: dienelactone hydrolase family protein [Muribaculaceae bacterium]|nr:dienelactone hydrolase family protein [Muribaculaceae bacterium]